MQVVEPLFRLGRLKLRDKVFNHLRHSAELLSKVALRFVGHYLRVEELLRNGVDSFNYFGVGNSGRYAQVELVLLPEGKADVNGVIEVHNLVLFELELVNEPFQRQDSVQVLVVPEHFTKLGVSKVHRLFIVEESAA